MDKEQATQSIEVKQKEADLFDLFKALWVGRKTIVLTIIIGLLGAVVFLHTATYEYEISMKVVPTEVRGANGLSSGLGGIASLAGLSGAGQSSPPFKLYLEAIYNRKTAEVLSKNSNFLTKIYKRDWNEENNTWQDNRSIKTRVFSVVKEMLGVPPLSWLKPSATHLQSFIRSEVIITENTKTPTTTITIFHTDPEFGMNFLSSLHKTVDDQIRKSTLERVDQYIEYLTLKVGTINIKEYRQAIIENLAEQEKLKMAASATVPFAASLFEVPITSVGPTTPSPLKVLIICFGIGLFVGILIVLRKSTNLFRNFID